jgi:hypothetical protein
MHAELVVPRLFAAPDIPRLPSLERLLARGRVSREEPVSTEDWLLRSFEAGDGEVPAGALTLLADGGDPGSAFWLRADPVHLRLEGSEPVLVAASVTPAEAQALTETLNRELAGRLEFHARHPARWCARCGEAGDLAGTQMDALLTEVQMVLHAHPLNAARELPVNSVRLWGAGTLPKSARGPWRSVTADDPVALGLARLAGMRHRALPASAPEWLGRAPEEGRHLIVFNELHDAAGYAHMEANWFAPLLEALERGRAGMITVRVPDAETAHETIRADLRRFWRRPRPLAYYGGAPKP